MEGAATTVYAQGGRGNSRLVAWEGERTVTFTMEDALISPAGFMILSGAGLIEADGNQKIYQHQTEIVGSDKIDIKNGSDSKPETVTIELTNQPYSNNAEDLIYVMLLDDNDEVISEPYIAVPLNGKETGDERKIQLNISEAGADNVNGKDRKYTIAADQVTELTASGRVLVDYYVEHTSNAQQIDITPDKFGGNYYLEASTLFRTTDGIDMPAEFIIPNCKIQSNFTFTMASSGDPSSFTFTMDAFPDYTRFNKTKKVLAAIQIIGQGTGSDKNLRRESTNASKTHKEDANGFIVDIDDSDKKPSDSGSSGSTNSGSEADGGSGGLEENTETT